MNKLVNIYILIVFTFQANAQNEVKKVYYLDTNYVYCSIRASYIGCYKKVTDTSYVLNYDLRKKNDWIVFYDKDFKIKQGEYFSRNDTNFSILYYRNGHKMKENRTLTIDGYEWIYTGHWHENGQVEFSYKLNNYSNCQTNTTYYSNGNKKWQGNIYNGEAYGRMISWYENGQKKSEKLFTEFNQELADNRLLESFFISEKYWDIYGNETEPFNDEIININTAGAPMQIPINELENSVPYYDIKQAEYDFTMSMFKDEVFKKARLKSLCNCNVGQVYFSFTVNKKGIIENIRLDHSLEKCVDDAFLKAIKKIKKWEPAYVNGSPVNTRVRIALELEKIKNATTQK